ETEAVKQAASALDAATLTQADRNALVQALAWQVSRDSTIVARDLASERETALPAPGLVKSSLVYAPDNSTVYFLRAKENDEARTDIHRIAEGDPAPAIAVNAGGLKGAPVLANSIAIVYVVPNVSPLRRPAGARSGDAGAQVGRGPMRPPATFAIADLASKKASIVAGTAPALSG